MNSLNTGDEFIETSNRDEEGDFWFIPALWSRKHWLILAALSGAAAGLAIALLQAPKYQTDSLVQLETRSSGVQLSADIADMLSSESEAITEIEIIKSRLVLEEVVDTLELDIVAQPVRLPLIGNFLSRYEFPKPDLTNLRDYAWHNDTIAVSLLSVPKQWLNKDLVLVKQAAGRYQLTLPDGNILSGETGVPLPANEAGVQLTVSQLTGADGVRFVVQRASKLVAVNRLRSQLTISEKGRGSSILRVSLTSTDPDTGEHIVREIVNAYIKQNIGRSAEEAERSLQFLAEQLPQVQQKLRQAENTLNTYRLESESIDLDFEAQAILERAVSLDAQISGLSLEESELSRRYTRNHPTYRALLEKKQQLTDEKLMLSASVKSLPATQQEILSKTRDVEVSQQIYLQLLNKSQELSVMKAGAVGNVRLIDDAAANPSAVSPKTPLIVALATLMGGALAAVLILLKLNLSRTIESPEDISNLRIPTYAIVPLSRIQLQSTRRRNFELLAREHSNDMAVEALRNLRTSLYFNLPDRERNVISVTGPSPGIGKSFVCANLAYLAARSGARVLLVDGDMRRGNLGLSFTIPKKSVGLSQMLNGLRAPSEVMYEVDLDTMQLLNQKPAKSATGKRRKLAVEIDSELDSPDLFETPFTLDDTQPIRKPQAASERQSITLVPNGTGPDNPSELLMSGRFPSFLEESSHHFDLVIVDTPPVLAATDAMIIGKYCDMTLMVIKQGQTTTHEAEEVVRTFANSNVRIKGIVLNGYDANRGRYGKYSTQYGYRYAY